MALKSWLSSLKADVSSITAVQAPIYAGLQQYAIETMGVSGLSESGGKVAPDTADTAARSQPYHAEPAWALGCTGDTADTCKKIDTEASAEIQRLIQRLIAHRLTSDPAVSTTEPTVAAKPEPRTNRCIPWLTEREAIASKAYHAHHFACHQCIAAGRGKQYGTRCTVGLALWDDYSGAAPTTQPTKGTP